MKELFDKILALFPNAKFSLWEIEPHWPPEVDATVIRQPFGDFWICWKKSNGIAVPNFDLINDFILTPQSKELSKDEKLQLVIDYIASKSDAPAGLKK